MLGKSEKILNSGYKLLILKEKNLSLANFHKNITKINIHLEGGGGRINIQRKVILVIFNDLS